MNGLVCVGAGRDGGHGAVQLPRSGRDCEGEAVTASIAPTHRSVGFRSYIGEVYAYGSSVECRRKAPQACVPDYSSIV